MYRPTLMAVLALAFISSCAPHSGDTATMNAQRLEIHVAADGSDLAEGSAAAPFATLRRAQDEARRLKELESENAKLKRLLADAMLDQAALKDLLAKKF